MNMDTYKLPGNEPFRYQIKFKAGCGNEIPVPVLVVMVGDTDNTCAISRMQFSGSRTY